MIVFQCDAQAALAGVAVESVLPAANPADPASITVIDLFRLEIIIVENANIAEITRELDTTILAIF